MEESPGQNGHRAAAITVAVDPISLVVTECITVTSAMRKHARWAHSSISSILGTSSPRSSLGTSASNDTESEKSRISSKIDLIDEDGSLTSRWGLRGKKGQSMQDNPLMSAFAKLRADLKHCKTIDAFDAPSLLQPFLQVIRSSSTTAPITSLALIAITKMLAYNVIHTGSQNFPQAMQLLASSVTHCRFEGDNTPSDEVVFLRILKLMEDMICGPSGSVLGDQSVCEIMECALSICCHLRMSEVLRRSAEISMVTMCQAVFTRLKTLETEFEGEPQDLEDTVKQEEMDAAKIDSDPNAEHGAQAMQQESRGSTSLDVPTVAVNGSDRPSMDVDGSTFDPVSNEEEKDTEVRPYGLPSIRELFRVLADLLDPHDKQRTDTLRVMALRIVNVALEVAGPSIANHPSLASLAKDTLCRNLFQLVRSENIAILHESLRVAGTLLATCRSVLKLQQEVFLSYVVACLHPRVPIPGEPTIDPSLYEGVPQAPTIIKTPSSSVNQSGRSTPVPIKDRQKLGMEGGARKPDAREAMVESVGGLVRIPSFMVELFVNYDCEIDRSDLCNDMIGLLSRNAFPDSATWSTTNVPPLCLDSLLGYVQFIADRLDDKPITEDLPSPEVLREQRERKKIVISGATKFNDSPKGGIAYLASHGIIDDPNDPKAVTKFLQGTTRVDKKVLGEFISKRSNEAILDAFMGNFDFKGMRVDEALRQLLNTFRLPGESPLIERIVTVFSEKYYENADPGNIADKDAIFVLTYAIILLNTDLYNRNVKQQNRMTLQDFARNLRGVNGGKNFDEEYLSAIYDAIKTREIVLPEEHDNRNAFEHAWQELLAKTAISERLTICETNMYDADMFAATWQPIVATLNYVFVSATEDAVFQRVVAGYNQCAAIAARYGISECLDHIIRSLSQISGLATEQPPSTSLNTEIQANGKSIMVSKFAVDFGRDNKAELATLVLFRIINGNERAIRSGWKHIVRININLFVNSLIPTSFTSISRDLDLPPIPLQSPANVVDRDESTKQTDVGLFSAFTSYVSSVMNDEPPEPNDQEIEATLCAIDCINACRFEEILGNVSELPLGGLRSLTSSLLACLPQDDESSPRVITVKPDVHVAAPTRNGDTPKKADGAKVKAGEALYDPAVVYVLELATILALRDEQTIAELGTRVADSLQSIIHAADTLHPTALSRAVFYLLSLLRASNDHKYIRTPVVLHSISAIPEDLLRKCAQPVLKGLHGCISGPPELRKEVTGSPDFWHLLNILGAFDDQSAALVFSITESVVQGNNATIPTDSGINADNYEAVVLLLNAFASAGSVGARVEQYKEQPATSGRRGQPAPQEKVKPKKPAAVVRGTGALDLVSKLASRVPTLIKQSHLSTQEEAWRAYWSPIFRCLANQCLNPCRELRHQAISALQRCLLNPNLASDDHMEWTDIFGNVLFPLLQELLRPEVFGRDPVGMSETRVQLAQLLCKIFLHYLVQLSETSNVLSRQASATTTVLDPEKIDAQPKDLVLDVWAKILTTMDRLVNSGQKDSMLAEAVPESLKNILLVMSSGGYLVPPQVSATAPAKLKAPETTNESTTTASSNETETETATSPITTIPVVQDGLSPSQRAMWIETWTRLDRFLPNLISEVFPEAATGPLPRVGGTAADPETANVQQPATPVPAQESVAATPI